MLISPHLLLTRGGQANVQAHACTTARRMITAILRVLGSLLIWARLRVLPAAGAMIDTQEAAVYKMVKGGQLQGLLVSSETPASGGE